MQATIHAWARILSGRGLLAAAHGAAAGRVTIAARNALLLRLEGKRA